MCTDSSILLFHVPFHHLGLKNNSEKSDNFVKLVKSYEKHSYTVILFQSDSTIWHFKQQSISDLCISFFTCLPIFGVTTVFNFFILTSHNGFNMHSPNNIKHHFLCLYVICNFLIMECLFMYFAIFQLYCFCC